MSEFGDLIPEFVEESLEHLKNIEEDIIIIEQGSADHELINRVFRAVHSIKGGSSFLGLKNIEKLSHKMEDIFNMVRNNEMVFNSEISSSVLKSIDTLKDMLEDSEESDNYDIRDNLQDLKRCIELKPAPVDKATQRMKSDIEETTFKIDKHTLDNLRKQGKKVYIIRFEIIDSILSGKKPMEFFDEIEKTGEILSRNVDMELVLKDENFTGEGIPISIIYATVLEKDLVAHIFSIDEKNIKEIKPDSMIEAEVIEDVTNKEQTNKKSKISDIETYLNKEEDEPDFAPLPKESPKRKPPKRKSRDEEPDEDEFDSELAIRESRDPEEEPDEIERIHQDDEPPAESITEGELDTDEGFEDEDEEEDSDLVKDVNEYLTFLVGDEEYGIGITQVHEIVTLHVITHVPNSEDFTKGIINLRGDIIPVFDFRLRLKFEEMPYDEKTIILIVMVNGKKVGVIVDRVSEVIQFKKEEITEAPQMQQIPSHYVIGIGQKEGKFIILLKLKEIFKIDEAS
ncbi:MAG: chemotaxis protein CheW [Candidatus Omnitrophota bacterium]